MTITSAGVSGGVLTVGGSGFGSGPSVRLYETFGGGVRSSNWSYASEIGLTEYASGKFAGVMYEDFTSAKYKLAFPDTAELYMSYKVRIPEGRSFPGSSTPEVFPDGSHWKMSWLMDGDSGYKGDDDLCIPTWPNGTYWAISGNDTAFPMLEVGRPGSASEWFSFSGWNRVACYLKGGADPAVDTGVVKFWGSSGEHGLEDFEFSPVIFDGDDNSEDDDVSRWNQLNFPGWARGADNVKIEYTDIYVATGPGAPSRVEIGDNAAYDSCTSRELQVHSAWSDTSVQSNINVGTFAEGAEVFVFVTDEDGVTSAGFPLTLPSTEEPPVEEPPVEEPPYVPPEEEEPPVEEPPETPPEEEDPDPPAAEESGVRSRGIILSGAIIT